MKYYCKLNSNQNAIVNYFVVALFMYLSYYIKIHFIITLGLLALIIKNKYIDRFTCHIVIIDDNTPYAYKKFSIGRAYYNTLLRYHDFMFPDEPNYLEYKLLENGFTRLSVVGTKLQEILANDIGVWIWCNNNWFWKGKITDKPSEPDLPNFEVENEFMSSDSVSDSETESDEESEILDPSNNLGRGMGDFNHHLYLESKKIMRKVGLGFVNRYMVLTISLMIFPVLVKRYI